MRVFKSLVSLVIAVCVATSASAQSPQASPKVSASDAPTQAQKTPASPNEPDSDPAHGAQKALVSPDASSGKAVCQSLMKTAQLRVLAENEKQSLAKCVNEEFLLGGEHSVTRNVTVDLAHGPGPNNDIVGASGLIRRTFGF